MTKITLLSTSPRPEGNTVLALKEIAAAMAQQGGETELLTFANRDVRACRACNGCKGKGRCVLDDDFNTLLEAVRGADGFIIGAPVYFGTARGDCMNFLQRLGMVNKNNDCFLRGRVGGPLAVGRRGGHTATLSEMLMFFFINGMVVPGADYWNMGFGLRPGDVADDEEGLKNFRCFGLNVLHVAERLAAKE